MLPSSFAHEWRSARTWPRNWWPAPVFDTACGLDSLRKHSRHRGLLCSDFISTSWNAEPSWVATSVPAASEAEFDPGMSAWSSGSGSTASFHLVDDGISSEMVVCWTTAVPLAAVWKPIIETAGLGDGMLDLWAASRSLNHTHPVFEALRTIQRPVTTPESGGQDVRVTRMIRCDV